MKKFPIIFGNFSPKMTIVYCMCVLLWIICSTLHILLYCRVVQRTYQFLWKSLMPNTNNYILRAFLQFVSAQITKNLIQFLVYLSLFVLKEYCQIVNCKEFLLFWGCFCNLCRHLINGLKNQDSYKYNGQLTQQCTLEIG